LKELLTRIPVIVLEAYPTPPPLTRNLFLLPNASPPHFSESEAFSKYVAGGC
jgi:hypothetical protein